MQGPVSWEKGNGKENGNYYVGFKDILIYHALAFEGLIPDSYMRTLLAISRLNPKP